MNNKLKDQLEEYIENREIAGAALLVRKNGKRAYQIQCGYKNSETKESVAEDIKDITFIAKAQIGTPV